MYIITSIIIVMALLISVVLGPSTAPFDLNNPYWNGYSIAGKLCNVKPIYIVNQVINVTTLLVIPNTMPTMSTAQALKNYVINGGTLVILSNGAMFGNSLLQYLGINASITNEVITDPIYNVINEYFPLAYTVNGEHLILTLDNASALIANGNAHIIAETSAFSRLGNVTGPFIVAARFNYGNGKVIVITTPSIFMNSVITMNDNEEFLRQLCGNSTTGLLETLLSSNPLIRVKISLVSILYATRFSPFNYTIPLIPIIILVIMFLTKTKKET